MRPVKSSFEVTGHNEGNNTFIRRWIGSSEVRILPPFVNCEFFRIDSDGMKPFPCRGVQKVTYLLEGAVHIAYGPGNVVELEAGDLTSIMVGQGCRRSMNAVGDNPATGLTLWIDIPEPLKREEPNHIALCHTDLTVATPAQGVEAEILSGEAWGQTACKKVSETPLILLNISMEPGSNVTWEPPIGWSCFIVCVTGELSANGTAVRQSGFVEFAQASDDDPKIKFETSNSSAHFFAAAAEQLSQPIYHQGPFVDVSANWIHQAFDDYTSRKNGFEPSSSFAAPEETNGEDTYNPCQDGNGHDCLAYENLSKFGYCDRCTASESKNS